MSIKEKKQRLRDRIWKLMKERDIARFPLPCKGRIPNFEGSDKAAEKLRELEEWKGAKIIVANPDFAQREVRKLALRGGKILIMASPGLRHGYLKIDPDGARGKEGFASTIKGAFKYGEKIEKLVKPDLIVTGCVAVDLQGNRLGKGKGYGDREIKRFKSEFGEIPILTTIHDCQIVDSVPMEKKDQRIDIIVTPTEFHYAKSKD